MARILLAWELGGEYGHLTKMATVARGLQALGHEPWLAISDLSRAHTVLGDDRWPLLQAPVWLPQVGGLRPPENHVEILLRSGYHDPSALMGLVRGWQTLVDQVAPAVMVADYAPTALLATEGMPLPRMRLGAGFCNPPPDALTTPFRTWLPHPPAPLPGAPERVLQTINEVRSQLRNPSHDRLSALLRADLTLLTNFPELDPYADRDDAQFVGPIDDIAVGAPFEWPAGSGARVFAYLKPDSAVLEALFSALRDRQARTVAHIPGLSAAMAERLGGKGVCFSPMRVAMHQAASEADLLVCHGSATTMSAALLNGKPVLALPKQMEQLMVSRRAAAQGFARLALDPREVAPALQDALRGGSVAKAARVFAETHADHDRRLAARRVAEACAALVGHGRQGHQRV